MSIILTDYSARLIKKIMFSTSQEEVRMHIDATMEGIAQHHLNVYLINRFVDKMLTELEWFSPLTRDAQQWSNIKMARICFNQLKRKSEAASEL